MQRSRRCVQSALSATLETIRVGGAACSSTQIADAALLHQLDACYMDDLNARLRREAPPSHGSARFQLAKPPQSPSPFNTTLPNEDDGDEADVDGGGDVEWVYWSMRDSLLFCFTVITTIGYGNVAPQTMRGQIFVIIYGHVHTKRIFTSISSFSASSALESEFTWPYGQRNKNREHCALTVCHLLATY